MEHAIEQVAKRLHSSYCECEGWHAECQGATDGDRRVARRLAADGLISPAPFREEWGVQWDDYDIWDDVYYTRHEAETGAGDKGTPVHRYVSDWMPVDPAEDDEDDGSADQ